MGSVPREGASASISQISLAACSAAVHNRMRWRKVGGSSRDPVPRQALRQASATISSKFCCHGAEPRRLAVPSRYAMQHPVQQERPTMSDSRLLAGWVGRCENRNCACKHVRSPPLNPSLGAEQALGLPVSAVTSSRLPPQPWPGRRRLPPQLRAKPTKRWRPHPDHAPDVPIEAVLRAIIQTGMDPRHD